MNRWIKRLVMVDVVFAIMGTWACWYINFPPGYPICASILLSGLMVPVAVRVFDATKIKLTKGRQSE